MAIANLKNVDTQLTKMYANQVTTNAISNVEYVDKSNMLCDYMQMVALNNKMFLSIK